MERNPWRRLPEGAKKEGEKGEMGHGFFFGTAGGRGRAPDVSALREIRLRRSMAGKG